MKEIFRRARESGFTLVELLIVVALIAILSVAVLATINPIEQVNKARDSRVQNDAAEVLNAYERYYANSQEYPWTEYTVTPLTVDDTVFVDADDVGFGICGTVGASLAFTHDTQGGCDTATAGLLVTADELKVSFVGKDEFQTFAAEEYNGLWTVKDSDGSIYVCYVPKAKSNRKVTSTGLRCLDSTNDMLVEPSGTCLIPTSTTGTEWNTPTYTGTLGIFLCVPE